MGDGGRPAADGALGACLELLGLGRVRFECDGATADDDGMALWVCLRCRRRACVHSGGVHMWCHATWLLVGGGTLRWSTVTLLDVTTRSVILSLTCLPLNSTTLRAMRSDLDMMLI